jgi:alpha-glucosidase
VGNAKSPPPTNPYYFQEHRYDKTRPENLPFLEEMRKLLDDYGAIAMGELGVEENVGTYLGEYTTAGRRLHTAYTFQLLTPTLSAAHVRQVCQAMERDVGDGWPTWAFSNHDFVRVVSRWGFEDVSDLAAPMLLALLGSLRGSICVYQGEELGLTEADVPFGKLQDPYGKAFWPAFKGRDGCRTPMPWDDAAPNAGFTSGTPWLPVPPEHVAKAVSVQARQSSSVLSRVRNFLAWRRTNETLRRGTIEFLDLREPVLGLVRSVENERILCVFNLSRGESTVTLRHDVTIMPIDVGGFAAAVHDTALTLPPLGAFFADLKPRR